MKKRICVVFTAACMIASALTGCGNMQIIDTTVSFDKAIIEFPNGDILDGNVESWRDYDGSDQLQVKIDGVTYLVHSSNIVLIKEKTNG